VKRLLFVLLAGCVPNPAPAVDAQSALELRRAGRVNEAAGAYEELLRAEPRNATVWWAYAELLRHDLRRMAEAENAYARAVESDSGLAGAHHDYATLLAQTGRLEEALAEVDAAWSAAPEGSALRAQAERLRTELRVRKLDATRELTSPRE
jgi:tetratricopeptide (TPR) repeat protein